LATCNSYPIRIDAYKKATFISCFFMDVVRQHNKDIKNNPFEAAACSSDCTP
jgi:hypothetical protein